MNWPPPVHFQTGNSRALQIRVLPHPDYSEALTALVAACSVRPMQHRLSTRIEPLVALLCAVAVVLRLYIPITLMPLAGLDVLFDGGAICHVDGDEPEEAPTPPLHECQVCPACHLAGPPALAIAPAVVALPSLHNTALPPYFPASTTALQRHARHPGKPRAPPMHSA